MKTIRLVSFLAFVFFSAIAIAQKAPKGQFNKSASYTVEQQPGMEIGKVKSGIAEILNDKIEIIDKKNQREGTPKDISVLDDRIEFKIAHQKTTLSLTDILDYNIENPNYKKAKIVLSVENFDFITSGWAKRNFDRLIKLRQYLIFMQNQLIKKRYKDQITLFEPIASQYRAFKVKPQITEEQRKFIVQANSFSQQKLYDKAINLYKKAIELDRIAYSAAYSNLALLSAQVHNYDAAVYFMKIYLLLEPEASDARSAQDKIYEWEAQIGK